MHKDSLLWRYSIILLYNNIEQTGYGRTENRSMNYNGSSFLDFSFPEVDNSIRHCPSEPNTNSNGDFVVRATFSAKWLIKIFWVAFLTVCSRFFEWPFFLKSLDLSNEGGVEIGSAVNYQACQVVPGRTAYLDYQLENKWARVYPEIFKVERAQGKLVFKVLYPCFL